MKSLAEKVADLWQNRETLMARAQRECNEAIDKRHDAREKLTKFLLELRDLGLEVDIPPPLIRSTVDVIISYAPRAPIMMMAKVVLDDEEGIVYHFWREHREMEPEKVLRVNSLDTEANRDLIAQFLMKKLMYWEPLRDKSGKPIPFSFRPGEP